MAWHNAGFDAFRRVPAFRDVNDEALHALVKASRARESPLGDIIIWIDDSPCALVVVGTGRCAIVTVGRDGDEGLVRPLGPGSFVADMPPGCYLKATAHRTVTYTVPFGSYRRIGASHAGLRSAVEGALRQELAFERGVRLDRATCDQRTCLAHLLERLWASAEARPMIITRWELADMLGSCRQRVGTWLGEFEAEGWIGCEGGVAHDQQVAVLDPAALRDL